MTAQVERVEMSHSEIERLLSQGEKKLDADTYEKLERLVSAYQTLTSLIGDKDMSLRKLRTLLFGNRSEKTRDVVDKGKTAEEESDQGGSTPVKTWQTS